MGGTLMDRLSLPAWFRAEGMLMPWRAISDKQHQGRDLPEDLIRKRKIEINNRQTELHLRWACAPLIGVPLAPFKVWMRSVSGRTDAVTLKWQATANQLRATLPAPASMITIELQRGSTTAPVAVFGLRGRGDVRRTLAASTHIPSNRTRFTITLRGDGITDLLVLNGANPVVRMQTLSDTINDDAWKLVETVGLPVDGTWGNSDYKHDDQGIVGAQLNPFKAAIERVQRGAPPIGWPLITQSDQIAPPWEPVLADKLIDELHSELMPMLEACFEGLPPSKQQQVRPVINVDPPQQNGRRSSAKATAAIAPIHLLMLAATTDPALALATGFGTAWSLETSPIEGLSKDKSEFMVTGDWHGNPWLGDMELASYIPWPAQHLQLAQPMGVSAERDGLVRPEAVDKLWRESVRVGWQSVAASAALGRPTSSAFARVDTNSAPQAVSLMKQRDAGGWRPFVLSPDGVEGQANADRHTLIDTPVPLPMDGSSRALGYTVAVQDVFGIWSPWSDAIHQGRAPKAPGLGLISAQLDTRFTGSQSACPSEMDLQIAIDFSSRRPKRFDIFMGFYPMSKIDSPVPAALQAGVSPPSGMFMRELKIGFDDNDKPLSSRVRELDADGLQFVAPASVLDGQRTGTRRYRIQWPVPELDFSNTQRWGVRIWGRLESRMVNGLSEWGPVDGADNTPPAIAFAMAANPAPLLPLPLPIVPGVPMGSQPDGHGQSHVKVFWSLPSGPRPDKINIWETTETVLMQRAGQPPLKASDSPGQRLVALRERYDALPPEERRLAFRRFRELPGTARDTDIALPKGSTEIHFFTLTTTSKTGVESPWPVGDAEQRLHAFIAPTLLAPTTPVARTAFASSGGIDLEVSSASAIAVDEFRLYRTHSFEAVRRIGSMGPPFLIINASPPAQNEPLDPISKLPIYRAQWNGVFPADWQDWLIRVVAVPVSSVPESAQRGQISIASDVITLSVRPDTPPDLAPLTHSEWEQTGHGLLINSSTDLRINDNPSGVHRLLATVDNQQLTFDDFNTISVATSTTPPDLGDGPALMLGERRAGRTPISIWLKRADRLQSVSVTMKLIDPRGRSTLANVVVPPWQSSKLNVKVLDVFNINGRGSVITFSADAPVDSAEPGELTITVNPTRLSNRLTTPTKASFVLHKIPFSEQPAFTGDGEKIMVNRTTKRSPFTYAVLVRGDSEPSIVISIEMNNGVSGSARHSPATIVRPDSPFRPPVIRGRPER